MFKEPPDSRYAAAQESLKLLLSPAEFAAARRTTRNAHYTDAGYVRAIWDAMRKLGFEGGQVLEPGSGSGTFVGLVPDEISADTHVTGVELDPITAAVSRALYPNQDVRTESFAESKVDDGSFDAAIGNVPFSDTKLFDPEYNPGRRHNMHNHFILKSLRMTRPGGLVSVITSRYTMDSLRPDAREDMAELGDLVGAVRLPSGAHERAAGTAVVTDLLVFRRREPGTPYAGLPFEQTRTVAVDGKDIAVNELFVDQDGNATDMVLGTFGAVHGMRGKDDLTVKGAKDAEPTLREALDRLVAQAQAKGLTQTAGRSPRPEFATTGRARKPDGYLQAREDGTFTRLVRGVEQPHKVPSTQTEELRQLLRLRDTAMALIDAEATSVDDTDEMKRLREELNEIYDSYVANPKWGPVSRFTETRAKGSGEDDVEEERVTRRRPPQGGFRADPFSAVVRSLEIYDPVTGTARKSDIFHRHGIAPRTAKTAAENPADALAITMDQVGEVDLEYIADLLGVDDETAAREALGTLVYDEPGSGRILPRAAYLSGNVRNKLDAARLAAAEDSKYDANVEALARVLPPDLTPAEIRAKMGAGWIEPKYVQQFLREILRDPTLTVRRKHGTNWEVKSDRKRTTATNTEWGIRERGAVDLAEDIPSQRPIQISVDDKLSQAKTEAAQAKAREIADRFETWAWEDPTRAR
ncbi:MAG TPA: helicase, partial [Micromonosporaceae bacterium]|nr:helicase [Micromonosporaceae bacterium]